MKSFLKNSRNRTTLACFSPPVILATFLIEAALSVHAVWKYRKSVFGRLAAVLLALLAVFQFAELSVCYGGSSNWAAKLAFVAISYLPIIGIDFALRISGRKWFMGAGYAIATAISLLIVVMPEAVHIEQCTGRFVGFNTGVPGLDTVYELYYLSTLLMGVWIILEELRNKKSPHRRILLWLLAGYAAFMVPAFGLYAAAIVTNRSFPSVLCGFAIFLALILSFRVLPLSKKLK